MNVRHTIAKNVAKFFEDGTLVNLGVGIPTLSANYVPDGVEFTLHAEDGFAGGEKVIPFPWGTTWEDRPAVEAGLRKLGSDSGCDWRTGHRDLCDASNALVILSPGSSCFNSSISFAIARGGHLDMTVLGGLQVDEEGNLANWIVPGKQINGMGGAMDIVSGAKKVVVAMEHCTKSGKPKVMQKCTMPLTAVGCVSAVVTELAVMEFIDGQLVVTAMNPHISREELIAKTQAHIAFSENVEEMDIID
jgi:acetate CoA/acetoacetate CoA-transferase beta subunit